MKLPYITALISLLSTVSIAQTVKVTGKVSDEKNNPIPYAFVRDVKHNYATFSDSTGFFVLKADPASSLQVAANNFSTATVTVDSKADMAVKLAPGEVTSAGIAALAPGEPSVRANTFLQNSQLISSMSNTGGSANGAAPKTIIKEGFNLEPTRGSRYLYDNWVVGYGINKGDSIVAELPYAYNYDKLTGNITYTNDGRSMATISTAHIKTFTLFDKSGHANTYENTTLFPNKHFVEVLLSTPKYKIFKKVDVKLVQADFRTNGVVESGHKYDEYVDNVRYYFVGEDGKPQSISLKKSTLKKLLGADAEAFIAAAGSRDVDEDYVRDLNSSLVK